MIYSHRYQEGFQRNLLVYLGKLDSCVEGDGFFDAVIPAQQLFRNS